MTFSPHRPSFQIIITNHAKDSLKERIGCSPDKYMKLATKAWASSEFADPKETPNNRYYTVEKNRGSICHHKKLLGQIWVFEYRYSENKAILITVYPPIPKPKKKVIFKMFSKDPMVKDTSNLTDAEQRGKLDLL